MFDPTVFAARRDAYMRAIGPGAVAVVRSLPERLRNGDAFHPFRQHSDLYYLTGFVEPDTTLVLRPGAETDRVVMFVRPRDPEMETWDGRRAGLEGAKAEYGADATFASAELPAKLWELIANSDELHYSLGLDDDMDKLVASAIARLRKTEKKGKRPPRAVVDPRAALHELRLHKRPEELAALRKAAEISSDAHVAAMQAGRPGGFGHELRGGGNYTFPRAGGARAGAVGAGPGGGDNLPFRAGGGGGAGLRADRGGGGNRDDPPLHRDPLRDRGGCPRAGRRGRKIQPLPRRYHPDLARQWSVL